MIGPSDMVAQYCTMLATHPRAHVTPQMSLNAASMVRSRPMATNTNAMVLLRPRVPLWMLAMKSVIRVTTSWRLLVAAVSPALASRFKDGATLATSLSIISRTGFSPCFCNKLVVMLTPTANNGMSASNVV